MLFGHQNDDINSSGLTPPPAPLPAANDNPPAVNPVIGSSLPTTTAQPFDTPDDNVGSSVLNQGPALVTPDEPAAPPTPPQPSAPEPLSPAFEVNSPAIIHHTPPPEPTTAPDTPSLSSEEPQAVPLSDSSDLLTLKQQALSELEPLVSQLDQTPEEKFRTTMMLIQSTDNQSLLHTAYAAAQAITDEKARAQAILDVVNEINYFTQQKSAA